MPTVDTETPFFRRLLLTGAAGNLGRSLRPRLGRVCEQLRLSDVRPMEAAGDREEVVVAALDDADAVDALLAGCDAVVHMGGVSTDGPWAPILAANIVGVHNLYEAARKAGTKRIVFASSNHATGFYPQTQVISPRDLARPDGNYGVSKVFGEALSRFYFDRYGIETACLRIGSSFPEPTDRRMLATWLSYDDLERLVSACLTAPVVGHSIVYGMSANPLVWWDNTPAAHLGFRPEDSSEPFRAALEKAQPWIDPNEPLLKWQGGRFCAMGPYER
jgi:uronate dehydrogenase